MKKKKLIKIGIFSTYDNSGAGNAAVKINRAFKKDKLDSRLYVAIKKTNNSIKLRKEFLYNFFFYLKFYINKIIAYIFCYKQLKNGFISLDLFDTKNSSLINKLNINIVQINWINNFLSLNDILKIKKPIVWRLSDMWAFTGVEHFTDDNRWYKKRITKKNFLDFDFLTWKKKNEFFKKKIYIVTPSKWLADKAKKSNLMKNCQIITIPTPIDTKVYRLQKENAHKDIPKKKFIILFAAKYLYEKRKGYDYFKKVTKILNKLYPDKIHFVTVGKYNDNVTNIFPKNTTHFGAINDEKKIVKIYNLSNVFISLSIKDNLPQTALEATMCGLPIVSLDIGGVNEIIDPGVNGNILKKINHKELKKVFDDYVNQKNFYKLKLKNRNLAKKKYSSTIIIKKYLKLYEGILLQKYKNKNT